MLILPCAGPMDQSGRGFRLQAKSIFFTFPQCDVAPAIVLEKLQTEGVRYMVHGEERFAKVVFAVVSRERHEDGGFHLHGVIKLESKVRTSDPRSLDYLVGGDHHGNIQSARSLRSCVKYVIKDGEFVSFGIDVQAFIRGRASAAAATLLDMIKDDADLLEIANELPGLYVKYRRLLPTLQADAWIWQRREGLEAYVAVPGPGGSGSPNRLIADWLNGSVYPHCGATVGFGRKQMRQHQRQFRAKQLWIHGPPMMGKSLLISKLSEFFRVYVIPNEDFYDTWYDFQYDVAVYDEFYKQKSVQFFNRWLDGQIMQIRKKGSQSMKFHRVPTIICSNFAPQDAFASRLSQVEREALLSRLIVVEASAFIDIDFVVSGASSSDVCIDVEEETPLFLAQPSVESSIGIV